MRAPDWLTIGVTSAADGGQVVRLSGELDLATAPQLSDVLRAAIESGGVGDVVVDLDALSFLDAAGVNAFIDAYTLAQRVARTLRVRNAQGEVDTVLRVSEVAALLHDVGKPPCFSLAEDGVGHFYGHAAESARMADGILRRLRFDTDSREEIASLLGAGWDRCCRQGLFDRLGVVQLLGHHPLDRHSLLCQRLCDAVQEQIQRHHLLAFEVRIKPGGSPVDQAPHVGQELGSILGEDGEVRKQHPLLMNYGGPVLQHHPVVAER